jgi:hypothetical protein
MLGDRRVLDRLEVVGSLWGTLEANRVARIANISPGGALIISPVRLEPGSTQVVRVTLEGADVLLDARVRHVAPITPADVRGLQFLIGLEFPAVPPALMELFA